MAKKPAKKSPARGKKKAPAKKKAASRPAPRPSSGGIVLELGCSECDEPLKFNTADASETLTCPECLLVVRKPDEDFVQTVQMHKGGEKKILILATIMLFLFFVATGGLIYHITPIHETPDENMKNIFLGAAGLFFVVSLACLVKYEKSRWKVYF